MMPHYPSISVRAQQIPDSPIRKLVPLAEEARKAGKTVYALNIGQPDVPTAAPFLAALKNFNQPVVGYGRSEGESSYREALSQYYHSVGIPLGAEDIVVTVGGSEAILFAIQATCEPGEEVICLEPFYTNYNSLARMSGVEVHPVRTHAVDGFHLPDETTIEQAINARTRAIILCSPNNPTGTVLTESELVKIGNLAKRHNLYIISDEAYREFVYTGNHTSMLHLDAFRERTILVDSISKRYSACGARIGCLATFHPEIRRAAVRMAQARLSPPMIEQYAAMALMQLPAHFFAPIKEEYKRRRDTVFAGLQHIPGMVCQIPDGAFYIMAELPIQDCEHFTKWLLTDFCHNQETLMLAPGPGFYARGKYEQAGQGLNQVRIAYVLEEAKLKRAMELLAIAIEVYSSTTVLK